MEAVLWAPGINSHSLSHSLKHRADCPCGKPVFWIRNIPRKTNKGHKESSSPYMFRTKAFCSNIAAAGRVKL